MTLISANTASTLTEDGVLTVSFADSNLTPRSWLTLQLTLEPDEQDAELGMNKPYLELNSQSRSVYGGVLSARLTHSALYLKVSSEAAKALGSTEDICVTFNAAEVDLPGLADALKQILHPAPLSVEIQ